MANPQFTTGDLAALYRKLSNGSERTQIGDRSVANRNVTDLIRLIGYVETKLGMRPRRSRTFLVAHNRGFVPAKDENGF